jgi:hypothetical protein
MSYIEEHNYDDIIHLPHHTSPRHPQMPVSDRAAQFSAFAALTGYDAAIRETARLTDSFVELDDIRKEQLNERLWMLKENQAMEPKVQITYFRPDVRKSGGAYVTVQGSVRKIDAYHRQVILEDGTVLPMENLYSIEGELFETWN